MEARNLVREERSAPVAPDDGQERALALVAHEIRGPLLGVQRAIERVLGRHVLSEEDQTLLTLASSDIQRLADTSLELLRWAALGAGGLRFQDTSLARLVEDVASSITVEEGGNRIRVQVLRDVRAHVDRVLVRSAVDNLVRNALVHSSSDAPVDLTLERTRDAAVIAVRDRGPGLPLEERVRVQDPFVRGRWTSTGGFGLGLFIARRAAESHGGSLTIGGTQQGAVFRIEVPLRGELR
jgi:two-component system, OmpR family, sensor kinase